MAEPMETRHLEKHTYAKFAKEPRQNLHRSLAKFAEVDGDLRQLLTEAGATPARTERGRWACPVCGKRARVAVDFTRSLFQCWTAGCTFHGSARSLARRLGHETDSPAWRAKAAKAARRRELEEQAQALRVRACQEIAEAFRKKMAGYEALRAARGQDIESLDRLLRLYADVLALNAQLLLLDVLPPLELCEFLAAPQDRRQAQIRQLVSRDGLFVNGRFFDLPAVSSQRSVVDVPGVAMPDESWRLW